LFDLKRFVRFLREAHSFSLVAYGEKSNKSVQIFQIFLSFLICLTWRTVIIASALWAELICLIWNDL